ncbi:MAG TPA: CAP domain-containing protein [Gaiellales bacterium]|jgi:uncharacterized protein YkwD|nr:CAP domain-containing protein [Gaiellales bacterium]
MRKILHGSLFLAVALVCVPAVSQAATRSGYSASTEGQVLVLLNAIRHEHGLSTLAGSVALRHAARSHTSDMLEHGYFEHNSPNERFDVRVRRFLKSPLVGENIAWGTGSYGTAAGLVSLWMHSPAHRHIILMPELHRVGLGIATGSYHHTPGAVMATADFSS